MGTVLLGRSELALSQQRTVARIGRSVERASRLIADLLDFTQARLGRGLAVSMAEMDLHDSLADTIEELRHIYPGGRSATSGWAPADASPTPTGWPSCSGTWCPTPWCTVWPKIQ